MGKKSSHKKQQRSAAPQVSKQAVRQGMELASLSGETLAAPVAVAKPLTVAEQTQYIRGDIAKVGILILAVAILLIAMTIFDHRSGMLSTWGHHIASFMRLGN